MHAVRAVDGSYFPRHRNMWKENQLADTHMNSCEIIMKSLAASASHSMRIN